MKQRNGLGVNRETVRHLTAAEQAAVIGGYAADSGAAMCPMRVPVLRALAVGLVVALAACAATTQDDQRVVVQAQQVTDPAYLWMTGTYDCVTNYHKVTQGPEGQWTFRRASAVYTLRPNATGTQVIGEYREEASNGQAGVDIDDVWGFVGHTAQGAIVDYSANTSDGTEIRATGTVRGSLTDNVIRGDDQFLGTITLADGTTVGWLGSEISIAGPGPKHFTRNWLISIGHGSYQLYMDSTCVPRLGPTEIARSDE